MGSDHVKVHDELTRFAGKVEDVHLPTSFNTQSLFHTMSGVRQAATANAERVHQMEQYSVAAQDGMTAYRDLATTADQAYTGTDDINAAEMNALVTQQAGVALGNPGTGTSTGNLPTPSDLDPAKQLPAWADGPTPGTGMRPAHPEAGYDPTPSGRLNYPTPLGERMPSATD